MRSCRAPNSDESGYNPYESGYTLMELMVAMPLMALLLLGLGSAIKLASKITPDGTSTSSAALMASRSMDLIAGDIGFATSITTDVRTAQAATSLTFSLPDRDGAAPATETINYSWSGIAGDPLLRSFNGTSTTIATNVQEFSLAYDKRAVALPTTYSMSAETLLISSDSSSSTGTWTVTSSNWPAQYFLPVFASNVQSWKVTKVQFRARNNGTTTGQTLVQIRGSSGFLPTSTVLDQATMLESSLNSAFNLQTFTFTNVPSTPPTTGLCLVLKFSLNSPSCDLQYSGSDSPNSTIVTTTSSGSVWDASGGSNLRYYVYGSVATPDPTAYQYRLTNVRCTLRVGSDTTSRLLTSIRVLNEPQVTGP